MKTPQKIGKTPHDEQTQTNLDNANIHTRRTQQIHRLHTQHSKRIQKRR